MSRRLLTLLVLGVAHSTIAIAQPPPPPPTMVAAPAPAPTRDGPALAVGTALVRGRVTDPNGRPLARAEIRIGNSTGQQKNGLTDPDGRFDLGELPAGTYTVSAAKQNYIRQAYGEQRPEGPGKRLTLADGQRLDNINFRLVRSGAISGKIVDEFGDPVTDVFVSASRYAYVQGTRRLMPSGRGGTTNDLGEYRVYGLSAGQYYVSATLRNFAGPMTDTADRTGYAPTFYPGTANAGEAQRLAVAAGQTVVGANLTLLPVRTAQVSGVAYGQDGKPLSGGMVMISPKSLMQGIGMQASPLRSDGRFVVSGLAPGEYLLRVGGNGAVNEAATTDITINGADVDNVEIIAVKPSTIRGRVVFTASASAAEPPKPSALDLGAMREWALAQPVRNPARVADDGTFEIPLAAGHVVLRVAPAGATGPNSNPWRLSRVLLHDVDVADSGIDVPPNAAIENVVVELTNKTSELSARVTDASGAVVRDCFVIVFAQDPSHWTVQTRHLSVGRPGADDLYHARLLPGDYYAVAMSDVEPSAWTDPDFLAQARERATKLTVGESDKKTLDLPLVPAPVY